MTDGHCFISYSYVNAPIDESAEARAAVVRSIGQMRQRQTL